MNENENLSCALPHQIDNWNSILWRKVIQRVSRLQRRIAKAVKDLAKEYRQIITFVDKETKTNSRECLRRECLKSA